MDPERCAPFAVGPAAGPYAAAGDEPPGTQGTPDAAPHLHPAPPRGPRLSRFPACGPLEPYLPEPAKPPAKYLQDLGPGPVLNGGHFYEGPAEGNAQPDPVSFPLPGPSSSPRPPSPAFLLPNLGPVSHFPRFPGLIATSLGRQGQCGGDRTVVSPARRQREAGGQGRVEWSRSWAHSGPEDDRT